VNSRREAELVARRAVARRQRLFQNARRRIEDEGPSADGYDGIGITRVANQGLRAIQRRRKAKEVLRYADRWDELVEFVAGGYVQQVRGTRHRGSIRGRPNQHLLAEDTDIKPEVSSVPRVMPRPLLERSRGRYELQNSEIMGVCCRDSGKQDKAAHEPP